MQRLGVGWALGMVERYSMWTRRSISSDFRNGEGGFNILLIFNTIFFFSEKNKIFLDESLDIVVDISNDRFPYFSSIKT